MEGSAGISQAALPSMSGCKDPEGECDHVHKRRHLMETPLQSTSGHLLPAVEKGVHQFATRKETIDTQVTYLQRAQLEATRSPFKPESLWSSLCRCQQRDLLRYLGSYR